MLLEVQNISKAAVVLGNTWVVNAVIISGVLAMILVANVVAVRCPASRSARCTLCLSRAASGCTSWTCLSSRSCRTRRRRGRRRSADEPADAVQRDRVRPVVRRRPSKDAALGANLIGALVGGLLQAVTFVTGIKALLLIVAALYQASGYSSLTSRRIHCQSITG